MRVRTRPYADLLERDGEALVLLRDGAGLVRLSSMGVAIVELATNGIDLQALAGALERRFGTPPDGTARDLTVSMVTALRGKGLLELTEPPPGGRHWRVSDDAAFVLSGPDRVVVLNLADPAAGPRALLGTAASVWHALVGEGVREWNAEERLLADLATAYATEVAAIGTDVRALLATLLDGGYLERHPAQPET